VFAIKIKLLQLCQLFPFLSRLLSSNVCACVQPMWSSDTRLLLLSTHPILFKKESTPLFARSHVIQERSAAHSRIHHAIFGGRRLYLFEFSKFPRQRSQTFLCFIKQSPLHEILKMMDIQLFLFLICKHGLQSVFNDPWRYGHVGQLLSYFSLVELVKSLQHRHTCIPKTTVVCQCQQRIRLCSIPSIA
jgi:hypothetical protein